MRGTLLHTQIPEGSRSLSAFINEAVMEEVERLEAKYNDGKPFAAVGARELPQGRPMGEVAPAARTAATAAHSGHVYRDCLVDEIPNTEPSPIDYLVIVSPECGTSAAAEDAATYYGDLRTGAVDTRMPADVQTDPPAEPACRERSEVTLDVTSDGGYGCDRGVFIVTLSRGPSGDVGPRSAGAHMSFVKSRPGSDG